MVRAAHAAVLVHRPDHNLQDIRAKIFPFKRRKVKAPETSPSVALPAKRKERSLSSLVVSAPKVPIQTGLTGRRSKASARKAALQGCNFTVDKLNKKEDSAEENSTSSSSPESPILILRRKGQDSSAVEPSGEQRPNHGAEDDVEVIEGKADLWTPLNCLVEAANRTKSSKSNLGLSTAKSELANALDSELHSCGKSGIGSPEDQDGQTSTNKMKNKERGQGPKVQDDKNGTSPTPAVKRRRLTAARKRAAMSEELSSSGQTLSDAALSKSNRRNGPIWFALVASEDQKGHASLPQISTGYLRIKDGKMPASFIQKYLVKKLDLANEAEVELTCRGEPVLPNWDLQYLVDLWFRTASTSKKVPASVGSSAKDFVMVLSYCRKVKAS
ncbi:hypothetical protein Tsubulata_001359 [Turnera subulata]|uniref:E3 ubiquitin protein ligase DRIP2 n=1 Tax=Turnera subulata TaxID=218843 RepID=A0A9Q0FJJ1_9ROSI|nr:hypothetical protein Tsubulata_001359 [Turnera subulata]